jgi:hypothetical protein
MLAGEANHLELFFLSHRYGKPKNLDEVSGPPIVFVSQHGTNRLGPETMIHSPGRRSLR